jgi:hypothetical protein
MISTLNFPTKLIHNTGTMHRSVWLIPLLLLLVARPAYSQYCNPAAVSYIVRDEKGEVLSAAAVKAVADQLPKEIGNARTSASEVSFAADKQTFYWQDTSDWAKGNKLPALSFSNAAQCLMTLGEATLQYGGKKMRLIFNIDIARRQDDRRPVIDSLPFQDGTFQLDLKGWTHDRNRIIPASHWKPVKPPSN